MRTWTVHEDSDAIYCWMLQDASSSGAPVRTRPRESYFIVQHVRYCDRSHSSPPVDFIDLRWILGFGITGSMLDEFSNLWTNPGSGRWLKFVEITRYSVETVSPLSNCVPKSSSYWPWMMLCYVADGICVQVWMAGWSSGTWTTWVMRWLGFAYDMRYSSFVQCFFKI